MEHFPARLTRVESDASVDLIVRHFDQHGFGLRAVKAQAGFIRFTRLAVPRLHVDWMDHREQL